MTRPAFPLICIYNDGAVDLTPSEQPLAKASVLTLLNYSDKASLFDKNGNKWTYRQVADTLKKTWLTKILAQTFYNPSLKAKVIWTLKGTYTIDELKNSLKHCVDEDDDIITQFEEADIIKVAIDKAASFEDVLGILYKYVFAVNEEGIWREQEMAGRSY